MQFSEKQLENWQKAAEVAARKGGQVLLDWLGTAAVSQKAINDFVTEADIASQKIIAQTVEELSPGFEFVGEESENVAHDLERFGASARPYWVVDPLDGTTNYLHQLPPFATSIGLVYQGRPIVGVVYDPTADQCFSAYKGGVSTLNGTKIEVSGCNRISDALIAASFPPRIQQEGNDLQQFSSVLQRCQSIRRLGSAAMNLCYVACGKLDGYYANRLKPWDIAAGILIVEQAGGCISNFAGEQLNFSKPQVLASASTSLSAEIQSALRAS